MTAKNSTFAGQLKHFAQSVDIVDSGIFDQVRDLVYKYVMNELKGEYFELLRVESTTGNGARLSSLTTFWSSSDEARHNWPIRAEEGSYTNPVTAAFDSERRMWLVSPDRKPLGAAEKYLDMWSNTSDAPPYRPSFSEPIRTVIIVPLFFRQMLGVYCLESSQYIEITDVAKSELRTLADALAILYGLWDFTRAQSTSTGYAISDLRDLLARAKFPKLAKPHMFLAFSSRADETVKLAIRDALDQFKNQLEWTDWSQMSDAGNISKQIGNEILESRFGICYLSEPVEQDDASPRQYADNPNVVFEAGMLHARTTATADQDVGEPAGWIPIREANSPPPPFDFASERILYIPRSTSGELNETKLRQMLADRIGALLRES